MFKTRWYTNAACACMLLACGDPPLHHGGGSVIGGSQAEGGASAVGGATFGTGGASAVGGATFGTGGASAVGSASAVGGATFGSGGASPVGGATFGTGGTTTAPACVDGDVLSAATDGGSTAPVVLTSSEDCFWQLGQVTEVTGSDADLIVDDTVEAQAWQGFGGAFTELGWVHLLQLSESDRNRALQLLFGDQGARLAWGRLPIGCNDYAVIRHSLDDTGDDVVPDSTESNRPPADFALTQFSIEGDVKSLIPFVKAAQAVKPELRFWASAWTPPVWMKTGYTKVDSNGVPLERASYYDGGSLKGDAATLQALAQYFVKYVQSYQVQGIDVELLAPQNEPAGGHTYPSCAWDTGTYTSFIGQYLGPALGAAGLPTKVMLGGSLDNGDDTAFVKAVLADTSARGYCAVAGLGYDMVAVSKVADIKSAGMPIWVSEHKAGNYPWNPASYRTVAPNDMAYAVETWGLIRDAIKKVGVTSYSAWHMVLDKVGVNIDRTRPWAQNALLVADSGQLTATPAYYVFRHFSRFVELGARVIGTGGADAVAFKNPDGSVVAVLHNPGPAKAITVRIRGEVLQFTVPQRSFATLVHPARG